MRLRIIFLLLKLVKMLVMMFKEQGSIVLQPQGSLLLQIRGSLDDLAEEDEGEHEG